MRRYILVPLILKLLAGAAGRAVAQVAGAAGCPATTEAQNIALARAWHEEVINRRNPGALNALLAAELVHHAAGGYPETMDAAGATAMMADFLGAFPDLRYAFDQFLVQDDHVVERYTASGTQRG